MPQSGLAGGQVFAGYTLIRRLGAGGMGEVYLAQHPRLPRRDALKILPGNLTTDVEFRQRFHREAELAAGLCHEHIVGIHDRGEYQGQLWISMEYVEGTDAADLLRGRYPSGMPAGDVAQIITAVARALDYAHSRGLLHRDVKPANILLGAAESRRRILLADFGIARGPKDLDVVDARADQYALGCTAFHLLTGHPPFENADPAVVISRHLAEPPPRVSGYRPELIHADAAIARALAKDPGRRFPSCADFAAALTGTAQIRPAAAPATGSAPRKVFTPPTATPPNTRSGARGPITVIAAIAAIALVAVAALVGVNMLQTRSARHGGATTTSATAAAPTTAAIQLTSPVTDVPEVLTQAEHTTVERALTKLYNGRGSRLWVVYVNDFGDLEPSRWAETIMRANDFDDSNAILAIATEQPAYSFQVPTALTDGKDIDVERIQRERIQPAVFHREWARAAVDAANGLDLVPD